MTDKEKLEALLKEFGLAFNEPGAYPPKKPELVIIEGGYAGFWAQFEFDADGKFVSFGAYE